MAQVQQVRAVLLSYSYRYPYLSVFLAMGHSGFAFFLDSLFETESNSSLSPFLLYKKNLHKPLDYIGLFGMQQLFSTKMTMKSGRLSFSREFSIQPRFSKKMDIKSGIIAFSFISQRLLVARPFL